MDSLEKQIRLLLVEVSEASQKIGLESLMAEHKQLQGQMQKADFWQDSATAQTVSKRAADVERRIGAWQKILDKLKDLEELVADADPTIEDEITSHLQRVSEEFNELKKELRFQGPYDDHDVILSIYAGAGGTDAQDWAKMLLRMYVRWAEKSNLKVNTLDQSAGEEAGIKSATIKISDGDFLYGKLAGEHGVHRLVRLSPFNADNLRQTSFAKVEILPLIDKPSEAQLDEKDLKIDVFRAGGHGGQSVNTTDSAVRVTHIPTGISVAIQNERSQLQNKETALNILRSKLVQLQLEQHTKNLAEIKGPNEQAAWGNQIRSYVLHPYKQVKDNRTGLETTEPDKVLDGNLDALITAYLEHK